MNKLKSNEINFNTLFWTFMAGSFAGFCVEIIVMFLRKGNLIIHKGLIYGPFIPIYGGGAVILVLAFYYIKDKRPLTVFFVSAFIGGVVEYYCSYFQEKIFGTISWDYSYIPFNFDGRTSLYNATLLGLLGLIFIKHFFPWICKKIKPIFKDVKPKTIKIITVCLLIFMIFNILISIIASYRQEQRRNNIKATNIVQEFLDYYYNDEFLNKIYNNAKIVK